VSRCAASSSIPRTELLQRIVEIDDDGEFRETIESILAMAGLEVHERCRPARWSCGGRGSTRIDARWTQGGPRNALLDRPGRAFPQVRSCPRQESNLRPAV
jgi:hypothetical protein